MLTDYEHEVAVTLIEALCEYGLTENLAQFGEHGTGKWFQHNGLSEMGFWASGGATKACIGHIDLDGWVIKVGYTEEVKKDYATYEYDVYCAAEEAGLAQYFSETIYIGEFCGRAFYVQQMANCDEDQVTSDWYERLRDQYNEDGKEYDAENLWYEIDDMSSSDKAMLIFNNEELADFLCEHRVNDLHEGNFGYINGYMVIIDMAGFEG